MKKIITPLLIFLAVVAGIYFILTNNKKKNAEQVKIVSAKNVKVSVNTAVVQRESVNSQVQVNGTFVPEKQAMIAAETGGQIISLFVNVGSYVSPGQVVARLKGDKQDVGLSNAQANLDNARLALSRFEAAYKSGGVTALQLDQARLAVKNANSQVKSAQLTSGDTTVRAKIGGIVNKKLAEVGTVVAPGTPILEVVNINSVKLRVEADESLVSKLSIGNIVTVKPAVMEGTVDGRITFIAPAATGALKFPVEISISNTNNQLRAGMFGTALFGGSGNFEMLVAPRSAFVGSISENKVYVVQNGVAKLVTVQSGRNFGDKVEIISGLNEGDPVITSGQINLVDGTAVEILK